MLRDYRESKGLTIVEVAKGSKIPVSTLYDVESGRRSLIAWKAERMAGFLEIPVETLFKPTYYRAISIPI